MAEKRIFVLIKHSSLFFVTLLSLQNLSNVFGSLVEFDSKLFFSGLFAFLAVRFNSLPRTYQSIDAT